MIMTTTGRPPRISVVARVSLAIARTLARICRLLRRTSDRLARVSAKLPPVSRCTLKAMTKKRNSGVSMRWAMSHSRASRSRPSRMPFSTPRNSPATGSPISWLAPMIASLIGRPERRARTIRSIASGNSAMNAATRRLPIWPITQCGSPAPITAPNNTPGSRLIRAKKISPTVARAPTISVAITYWPMLIGRPVRARRAASMSRRGSRCRARRSMRGVALSRRAAGALANLLEPASGALRRGAADGEDQNRKDRGRGGADDRRRKGRVGGRDHRSDHFEKGAVEPVILGARQEMRAHAGRFEGAAQLAVRGFALELEGEQVLGGDDLALHPDDLGDLHDAAHAVAHAADLYDQIDGRGDLRAHGARRQVDAGHADHVLEPGQRLARAVGVDRAHRAVMAGVHRLQHVERFGAADLAEDDAVRAHA